MEKDSQGCCILQEHSKNISDLPSITRTTAAYDLLENLLYRIGTEMGKVIREKVESQGLPLTIENFLQYSDFAETRQIHQFELENKFYEISHYHQPDDPNGTSEIEISRLFCHLDKAMLEGYSPQLAQKHTSCLAMGSHTCRFVSRITS